MKGRNGRTAASRPKQSLLPTGIDFGFRPKPAVAKTTAMPYRISDFDTQYLLLSECGLGVSYSITIENQGGELLFEAFIYLAIAFTFRLNTFAQKNRLFFCPSHHLWIAVGLQLFR